jgi:hypothetical protein
MSDALIRAELETRLMTWASAQGIPVAWEQVDFEKPTTKFLQPYLIPVDTLNPTTDGKRARSIGLFQVNCWAPVGKGMGEVEALAQAVIDLFPLLPKTGAVSIEQTPSTARPIADEPGWIIVPVTIKYRNESTI